MPPATAPPTDLIPPLQLGLSVSGTFSPAPQLPLPVPHPLALVPGPVTTPIPSLSSVPDVRRSSRIRTPLNPADYHTYTAASGCLNDVACTAVSDDFDAVGWTLVRSKRHKDVLIIPESLVSLPCSATPHHAACIANDVTMTSYTREADEHHLSTVQTFLAAKSTARHPSIAAALRPQATSQGSKEISLRAALSSNFDATHQQVQAAVAAEMDKMTVQFGVFREVSDDEVDADAVHVYSSMLIKMKSSGEIKARLAAGGNRMPDDSFCETFAPCASDESKKLMIASYQAFAKQSGVALSISDFDVVSAFLHIELTKANCPRQIIMHLQKNLPHPLAGKKVILLKGIYGLKQSNHMFDDDFRKQCALAGFEPTAADPCVYVKSDPSNPLHRCAVCMTVDDGLCCCTYPPLFESLIIQLESRYGPLKRNNSSTAHTGMEITHQPNGGVTLTQRRYIHRIAASFGVVHLAPVHSPSLKDLFHVRLDSPPTPRHFYQRLVGSLVHALKTRDDIRKEVSYLSTKVCAPTEDDLESALHVLRYLHSTADLGPTYNTDEGVVLYGYGDASFGVHANGCSHSGFFVCVGRHNAASICKSRAHTDVSLSPMHAEYFTLTELGKQLIHSRQFLSDLGFPQHGPTIIFEDNKPAIDLAVAPQITRKSKHLFIQHHFIRELVQKRLVAITHLPTEAMTADLLTKPLAPKLFIHHRSSLFNEVCRVV